MLDIPSLYCPIFVTDSILLKLLKFFSYIPVLIFKLTVSTLSHSLDEISRTLHNLKCDIYIHKTQCVSVCLSVCMSHIEKNEGTSIQI